MEKAILWDFQGWITRDLGTSAFTVFECFSDTTNLLEDERSLEENQDSQSTASHVKEAILDLMAQ